MENNVDWNMGLVVVVAAITTLQITPSLFNQRGGRLNGSLLTDSNRTWHIVGMK